MSADRSISDMTETDFRIEFVNRYSSEPWWRLYPTNTGGVPIRTARGQPRGYFRSGLPTGWPDITGYLLRRGRVPGGRMITFELKFPKTPHTKEQKAMASYMLENDVAYAFHRCSHDLSLEQNLTAAHVTLLTACGLVVT